MERPSTVASSQRSSKLIVVDDPIPGKTAGGVQLLAKTLAGEDLPGVEVIRATSDQVLHQIEETTDEVQATVYVQKSGSLSPEFASLAQTWLAAGARVVEKNVFARASRFRPNDANYHMSLMSDDGAYRYVLRSLFVPGLKIRTYLHLTLPTFELAPKERGDATFTREELTLLRIGRPDPIKWSEFEREFALNLARSSSQKIRLVRVGYPSVTGQTRSVQEGNLTIEDVPYAKDTSSLYTSADVYLHHSRIGETFGNTLAEAKKAGLPVIMAADLYWDCAGIELLTKDRDVIGEPQYLSRNAASAVASVMTDRGLLEAPPGEQLSPAEFIQFLTAEKIGGNRVRSLPSLRASVGYLWGLINVIKGANLLSFMRALLTEPVRSVRHARRFDA